MAERGTGGEDPKVVLWSHAEPGRGEVTVQRERVRYRTLGHDREADGVGERELLVGVALEPIDHRTCLERSGAAHHDVGHSVHVPNEREGRVSGGTTREQGVRLRDDQVRRDDRGTPLNLLLERCGQCTVVRISPHGEGVPSARIDE